MFGLYKVLQGNIAEGIHIIDDQILRQQREGYLAAANWLRLNLAQVYLEIIAGNEKPRFMVLLMNLPILLKIMITASSRIRGLMADLRKYPYYDLNSFQNGRSEMILGLLYKIKKKRALAVQHLTEGKRILAQFGQTPMLARVETALAELGQ